MPTPPSHSGRKNHAALVGLLMACPYENENPADCPLHEARKLDLRARFDWAKRQSEAEVSEQLATCKRCIRRLADLNRRLA